MHPSPCQQDPARALSPRLVSTVQLEAGGFSSLCWQGTNPAEELNIHPLDQLVTSDHSVAA